MDIKRAPRPWYKKYIIHISAALLLATVFIYIIYVALLPDRKIIDSERVKTAEVKETTFMEFIECEGIILPIKTIQLNATESGFVEQIACEEGTMLHQGDTILILNNPELLHSIDKEREEWEKSKLSLHEQKIQMEQKNIDLRMKTLEQEYQISSLERKLAQIREEYSMGIKSRAELNIVEAENEYLHKRLMLQIQSLKHDSATTAPAPRNYSSRPQSRPSPIAKCNKTNRRTCGKSTMRRTLRTPESNHRAADNSREQGGRT